MPRMFTNVQYVYFSANALNTLLYITSIVFHTKLIMYLNVFMKIVVE